MKASSKAAIILLLLSGIPFCSRALAGITRSQAFVLNIGSGAGLGIQTDYEQYVRMNVAAGTWRTAANTVYSYDGSGFLSFTNNVSVTLEITYSLERVTVAGDKGNAQRVIDSGQYIEIDAADLVVIRWTTILEPFFPLLFIFGVCGLVCVPAGFMMLFRHGTRLSQINLEDIRAGIIFIVLGVCFILMWVYA